MAGKEWTTKELVVLENKYQSGLSAEQICKLLPNRSINSIHVKANRLGLNSKYVARKYSYDEFFWSEYNKYNCYYAGWLAADGSIYQRQDGGYTVGVEVKDRELIERFLKHCKSDYPIRGCKQGTYETKLNIGNRWKEDLAENFNIVPQKTYCLAFPWQLPENLIKYFIIGFIDGDGCFHKIKRNGLWSLSFASASYDILDGLNLWFSSNYQQKRKRHRRVGKNGNNFQLHLGGKIAENIRNDLKTQIPECHLSRKWNAF